MALKISRRLFFGLFGAAAAMPKAALAKPRVSTYDYHASIRFPEFDIYEIPPLPKGCFATYRVIQPCP